MGIQTSTINSGPVAGFKNRIINGNFDFWQRGTSLAAGAGSERYLADRFATNSTGSTCAPSQQSFTLGQTDVPNNPTYFHRTVVASVAGANNFAVLNQYIEDVRTLAGQQITVSFWAKADASKSIAVEFLQNFGSGGSPSTTVTGIGSTKIAITTSWQKITVTATLPSISGKTIGTDANSSKLQLAIWFDAGSNFNSRTGTLGQQSGTFDIAQVQLEQGPIATTFEQRDTGTELQMCQRYYYQTTSSYDFYGRAATAAVTSYIPVVHEFPVIMRIAPNFSSTGATFSSAYASPIANYTTTRRHLTVLGLSNTANLDAYYFLSTGALTWSAEL